MIHRLTASGLGRARRCAWWARPEAEHISSETIDAKLGTIRHSIFGDTITGGDRVDAISYCEELDDSQTDAIERMYEQWLIWWKGFKKNKSIKWQSEVPVALDVSSGKGRLLAKSTHRDYGVLSDYEIPGTVDLLGDDGTKLYVGDFKTGHGPVEGSDTNPQLAHNGSAMMAATGRIEANVFIVKATEDYVYEGMSHKIDAMSAELFRDELKSIVDSIPTSDPNPGPWCNWCPAKVHCPATGVRVAEVVSATALVRREPMSLSIRDNDHAAGMLVALGAVNEFSSELGKRLRAFADAHGGIQMPDGTLYARSDVRTEKPDLTIEGAAGVLESLGASAAIKKSTTWTAVKDILGAKGEKTAREALRNVGAVKSTTVSRYEAREKKSK